MQSEKEVVQTNLQKQSGRVEANHQHDRTSYGVTHMDLG
jgi:hypothetical protein